MVDRALGGDRVEGRCHVAGGEQAPPQPADRVEALRARWPEPGAHQGGALGERRAKEGQLGIPPGQRDLQGSRGVRQGFGPAHEVEARRRVQGHRGRPRRGQAHLGGAARLQHHLRARAG
eukprot:15471350-Alexandrium_andersonii.AAC.1